MRALKFDSAEMEFFAYTLYFLQLYNKPKKAAFARRLNVEGIDRECPIKK